MKWPQEIEEALVIERNGWADSNMDYCVNCAARGNIKFRRSTSSWTKLIKSNSQISEESIRWSQWFLRSRWMIPSFRKINENSRNEETRFEFVAHRLSFVFLIFSFVSARFFEIRAQNKSVVSNRAIRLRFWPLRCGNMETLMSVKRLAKSKIESDVLRKNFF